MPAHRLGPLILGMIYTTKKIVFKELGFASCDTHTDGNHTDGRVRYTQTGVNKTDRRVRYTQTEVNITDGHNQDSRTDGTIDPDVRYHQFGHTVISTYVWIYTYGRVIC